MSPAPSWRSRLYASRLAQRLRQVPFLRAIGRLVLRPYRWVRSRAWAKRIALLSLCGLLGLGIIFGIADVTTDRIAVFGFHNIIDPKQASDIPPQQKAEESDYFQKDFEMFVNRLVDENYWFLSAEDLYDYFVKPMPNVIPAEFRDRRPVAISLDDGYATAHKHVLATLEKVKKRTGKTVKVIWFVNPAFLGRTDTEQPRMTCENLQEGWQAGFYDVQSHTSNHQDLTKLKPQAIRTEFKQAQDQLRNCFKKLDPKRMVARHVAYPFGKSNYQIRQLAGLYHVSGYRYDSRFLRPFPWRDRFNLSRIPVNKTMPVNKLLKRAAGQRWVW